MIHFYVLEQNEFSKPRVTGYFGPRSRHTAELIDDKIYVFGGYDGISTFQKLAVLDPETFTWTYPETFGLCPASRSNHSSAVVGKKMFIMGGNNDLMGEYQVLNDFYVLDTETMTWSKPQFHGQLSPRSGFVLLAIQKRLYLFGGGVWNKQTDKWIANYNTICVYDTETNIWSEPPMRNNEIVQSATFPVPFVIGDFIFIFGGGHLSLGQVTNELYMLDTYTHTWYEVSSDKTVRGRDMATATPVSIDSQTKTVYLFGGQAGGPLGLFETLTMKDLWFSTKE